MLRLKEPVNVITHFVGAVLSLVGLIWLASLSSRDTAKLVTVVIFGTTTVLTYLASTALHYHHGPAQKFFQRLDHAAIYSMIAGTYTPFGYHFLDGKIRWLMLGIIWLLALIGIVTKLFFFWQGHLSTLFYIFIGWVGVIPVPRMLHLVELGMAGLLLGGGLIYTIGAVVYATRKPNFHPHFGHHELWHLFVLAGSAFHFCAVLFYVVGF